ncbi:MAG: hypothetical protein A2V70_18200 [Planctomycetes bacterium RBG_13_63_9]|nr:MAG: hypothetical protein A2V70_18200 [Planctomycetes bacterium RBG_13_63_9]
MPIQFTCPNCGLRTKVSDEYTGKSGPCAGSGQTITVPPLGETLIMPISFQCPHCGVRTQVGGQFAGQTSPCRQCGQTVTFPHPGAALHPAVQSPRTHGVACPRCGGQSSRPGPWPWYLGTIGAIFVSARRCNLCGHAFDARKPQADFAKRKFNLALLINGSGGLGILTVIVLLGWFIHVTMK